MKNVKTLESVMSAYYPEQEYVIDRLIPEASITILSGTSRSYKTYTLLHMAICVARGDVLFGQFGSQQTGVLVIDEENGERLLQKRLFQLGALADLPIYFMSYSGFTTSDDDIDSLIETCKDKNIKFVIVDSLIRIHNGEENSAKDMSKVFKQLRRVTESGIALLVTQHNRKQNGYSSGAGDSMRGSTDIMAAIDSHIGVSRKNKWYLTFDQTKQRYDVELDPFGVKVNATDTTFEFEYLGQSDENVDNSEVIRLATIELLSEHGTLNQRDLLTKLKERDIPVNEHKLRELLKFWVIEKMLQKPTTVGKEGKFYALSEQKNE